jgi:ADP-ribose pyrophosphatase YjhB (NUDIX family)|tara:strand:+ start:8491 stop:9288 length:798 start_codon:yes stop_codon:yes gene_type:complete
MSNSSYNFCNNCGKNGHQYHQCKLPITSIGIIAFKHFKNELKYLIIRRRNTLGYIDFMRGKYILHNVEHIKNIIDEMTLEEKDNLLHKSFYHNWEKLWGDNIGIQYRGEEDSSYDKFKKLLDGYFYNNEVINLKDLIKNSTTCWIEPEWGFPKGRRNYQEKDITAAIREWEEETGYSRNDISIILNMLPYEEIFTGSNNKSYKHKYFIALFKSDNVDNDNFQKSEVSAIGWKTYDECSKLIRFYNLEKLNILNKTNKVIKQYRLY